MASFFVPPLTPQGSVLFHLDGLHLEPGPNGLDPCRETFIFHLSWERVKRQAGFSATLFKTRLPIRTTPLSYTHPALRAGGRAAVTTAVNTASAFGRQCLHLRRTLGSRRLVDTPQQFPSVRDLHPRRRVGRRCSRRRDPPVHHLHELREQRGLPIPGADEHHLRGVANGEKSIVRVHRVTPIVGKDNIRGAFNNGSL